MDLHTPNLQPVQKVAREVLGPICPSASTLLNWRTVGINAEVLQTVQVGTRYFTTRDEFESFITRASEGSPRAERKPEGSPAV